MSAGVINSGPLRSFPKSVKEFLWAWRLRNAYSGVYKDFAAAARSVPRNKPLGYDQPGVASRYLERLNGPLHDDYPALFWMGRALQDTRSVFEIGGHVGLAFYGFERYLGYPAGLNWTILDIPSVAAEGRRLARERERAELSFITEFAEIGGAETLLAAGSLQYIESPDLSETIKRLSPKPKHIIINKTPVWDGPGFVTLQNLGCSWVPYQVRNRKEFVDAIAAQGYKLVDTWRKDRRFRILWHPDKAFNHYAGFCFQQVQ
jgi:putative methyltransferase (TIGR04325 family)